MPHLGPVSRWDVFWANLEPHVGGEQAGHRRPAVVVSARVVNQSPIATVIVVPLTRLQGKQRAVLPFETVIPEGEGGAERDSIALPQQVRVVSSLRLLKRMGRIREPGIRARIEDGLMVVLDLRFDS